MTNFYVNERTVVTIVSHRAMGLAPEEETKNTKITCLDGRAQNERQELKDATEATDQEGPFRDIGGHGFQIVFEKGNMCNFPITIIRYWGEVPTPTIVKRFSSKTPIRLHLVKRFPRKIPIGLHFFRRSQRRGRRRN